ncbi:MAG: TatD family hydrolase [Bacteroidales bacterium]|nr:TatD family hydrolase [Bacteroidales bacterium]
MSLPFINIHTHNKLKESEIGIESFSIDKVSFYQEWPQSYSVGLHPWYLYKLNIEQSLKQLEYIASNVNMKAVGECGLDRAIARNFDEQKYAFLKQIEIAEFIDKPMIIHNVRAYSDFLGILKNKKPVVPFIFHAYNSNKDILDKLIKYNVYFSMGAEILVNNSKAQRILPHIPINRLFIETDEWQGNIEELYSYVAMVKGFDIDRIKSEVYYNYRSVFV